MSKRSLNLCATALFAVVAGRTTPASAQTAGPPPVLTLDAAVTAALGGNRHVQATALGVTKAADVIAETKTARLPQFDAKLLSGIALTPIDFTIPRGTLGDFPATGPIPANDATIDTPRQFAGVFQASMTQPVSQLFKIGLAVRQAEVGHQLADEALRVDRQELVRQVRVAYADLAQLQTQITSAEAALKSLNELAALTDRRLADETVLKSDALAVKARVSQQEYRLLTLRDSLASNSEAFNRLLGRDLTEPFSVEPLSAPTLGESSSSDAERLAVERRPELKQAHLEVTKASLDVRRTRAEAWPEISVQLSYLSFPNMNFLPKNIAHAGLFVDWQPFDWGQRRRKVAELTLAQEQASLAASDVESQARADVRAATRHLAEARALVAAAAIAQESDRERLRVLTNKFQENAALLADVLQAQASMADTDAQYQQAVAGFWTAKANFDRAVGENF
jgi:outer membrane protein TolC